MRDQDQETFMVEMCKRWPNKFPDAELIDMHHRLRKYMLPDVLAAADEHKNTSKFVPKISELLGRLKGKERDSASGAPEEPKSLTYAQTVRAWVPGYAGKSDAEVILRSYRAQWKRYADDANSRFAAIVNAGLPTALAQRAIQKGRQQAEGFRSACRRNCISALVSIGVSCEDAETLTEWLWAKTGEFRSMLEDLRINGVRTVESPSDQEDDSRPSGERLVEVFA